MQAQHSARSKRVIPVKTLDQARTYVIKNPKLNAEVLSLNSTTDTSRNDRELYKYKTGDVVTMDGNTYKVLSVLSKKEYRISYVLLDAARVDKATIDSARARMVQQAKQNMPLDELGKAYAKPADDTEGTIPEWFDDYNVMPELVNATKLHKKGEVYTVDVPERKWYYVVKLEATRKNSSYKILKIPGLK